MRSFQGRLSTFINTNELRKINATRRILIVDDEPFNVIGLTVVLQQVKGYKSIQHAIDTGKNGQEAINAVKDGYQNKSHSYGLIFMDCQMPIKDGFEASDSIRNYCRRNNITQPMIIACTGHTEEEFINKAWRHGMDEVLSKPVAVHQVATILKEIVKPIQE